MTELLHPVLEASGGVASWKSLTTLSARIEYGGPFWQLKGQPGLTGTARVDADVQAERITHRQESDGTSTQFDARTDRVTVTPAGRPAETLDRPRESLAGAALETPWTLAQAAYFRGYATWHYLVEPYVFTWPGVVAEEAGPWLEDGATWRTLDVTFPPGVVTHNATQRYYFDDAFRLRRMDYAPEVLGSPSTAHYVLEETVVNGIVIPTSRHVYTRAADGRADRTQAVITLELSDIRLS